MYEKLYMKPRFLNEVPSNSEVAYSVLEINFVQYWPSGHLSWILTGQTVSFTARVQEQLNLNDKRVYQKNQLSTTSKQFLQALSLRFNMSHVGFIYSRWTGHGLIQIWDKIPGQHGRDTIIAP